LGLARPVVPGAPLFVGMQQIQQQHVGIPGWYSRYTVAGRRDAAAFLVSDDDDDVVMISRAPPVPVCSSDSEYGEEVPVCTSDSDCDAGVSSQQESEVKKEEESKGRINWAIVKREPLGVKREPLGVKREPLGVKREPLGVKREIKPPGVKREIKPLQAEVKQATPSLYAFPTGPKKVNIARNRRGLVVATKRDVYSGKYIIGWGPK
jgi:hypothetical protein